MSTEFPPGPPVEPEPAPLESEPAAANGRHAPARPWVAGAVAAGVLAMGGYLTLRAASNHTTTLASASPGGGAVPGGNTGPGGRGGTFGTLQSVSGSTLTVASMDGSTVTVTATPSTAVSKAVTGAVSDIEVGDTVIVMGPSSGTDTVTAGRITDVGSAAAAAARAPGGMQGNRGPVNGTVASVSGASIVVTTAGNTPVTVQTSASTQVTLLQTSTLSALTVGQPVMVRGTSSNGAVTATAIEQGSGAFGPGMGGPPPDMNGQGSGRPGANGTNGAPSAVPRGSSGN